MWVIRSETSMRRLLSRNEDGGGATTKLGKLMMKSNLFGRRNWTWNCWNRKCNVHIIKCAWRLDASNKAVTNNECLNQWNDESGKMWPCWPLNCKWINDVTWDVRTVMKTSQTMVHNAHEVAQWIVSWWIRGHQWNQWKCQNLNDGVDMKEKGQWGEVREETRHKWGSVLSWVRMMRSRLKVPSEMSRWWQTNSWSWCNRVTVSDPAVDFDEIIDEGRLE